MQVFFYRDEKGNEPVAEYLKELKRKGCKDSRVNLKKIQDYIKLLTLHGVTLGEPYVKHLEGELWELRPIRNRIIYAYISPGEIILLHHFKKETKKTPKKEKDKARRNLENFKRRIKNEPDRKYTIGEQLD